MNPRCPPLISLWRARLLMRKGEPPWEQGYQGIGMSGHYIDRFPWHRGIQTHSCMSWHVLFTCNYHAHLLCKSLLVLILIKCLSYFSNRIGAANILASSMKYIYTPDPPPPPPPPPPPHTHTHTHTLVNVWPVSILTTVQPRRINCIPQTCITILTTQPINSMATNSFAGKMACISWHWN